MRRKKVDADTFTRLLKRFDALTPDDPVHSPCVGVCLVNKKTRYCEGCFRTIDEIAEWGAIENTERRAIWLQLKRRYSMR